MTCSVAQALDVLGDWWTLLIVREALSGTTRFKDFERYLGIAKNILTVRLEHLVEHGVFTREPIAEDSKRLEYRLTAMGKDLATVIIALREWSDRWIYGEGNGPMILRDVSTGERTLPLRLRDADGEVLKGRHLSLEPGPGADRAIISRFGVPRQENDGS